VTMPLYTPANKKKGVFRRAVGKKRVAGERFFGPPLTGAAGPFIRPGKR